MATSKRLPLERENCFPNLFVSGYRVTSPEDSAHNCVSWAAGQENTQEWWDPFAFGRGYYWPAGLPRNARLSTFIKLYATEGAYVPCETPEPEPGFEKLAIYADASGEVTHVARQTENGAWTSKLGELDDIEQELDGLVGSWYGAVVQFLRRLRPTT